MSRVVQIEIDKDQKITSVESSFIHAAVREWTKDRFKKREGRATIAALTGPNKDPLMTVTEFILPEKVQEFKDFAEAQLITASKDDKIKFEDVDSNVITTLSISIIACLMFDFYLYIHKRSMLEEANRHHIWSESAAFAVINDAMPCFDAEQEKIKGAVYDCDDTVLAALGRFKPIEEQPDCKSLIENLAEDWRREVIDLRFNVSCFALNERAKHLFEVGSDFVYVNVFGRLLKGIGEANLIGLLDRQWEGIIESIKSEAILLPETVRSRQKALSIQCFMKTDPALAVRWKWTGRLKDLLLLLNDKDSMDFLIQHITPAEKESLPILDVLEVLVDLIPPSKSLCSYLWQYLIGYLIRHDMINASNLAESREIVSRRFSHLDEENLISSICEDAAIPLESRHFLNEYNGLGHGILNKTGQGERDLFAQLLIPIFFGSKRIDGDRLRSWLIKNIRPDSALYYSVVHFKLRTINHDVYGVPEGELAAENRMKLVVPQKSFVMVKESWEKFAAASVAAWESVVKNDIAGRFDIAGLKGSSFDRLVKVPDAVLGPKREMILAEVMKHADLEGCAYEAALRIGLNVEKMDFSKARFLLDLEKRFVQLLNRAEAVPLIEFLEKYYGSWLGRKFETESGEMNALQLLLNMGGYDAVIVLLSEKKYEKFLYVHEKDSTGKSAFDYACEMNRFDVMAAFFNSGARVSVKWYEYAKNDNQKAIEGLLKDVKDHFRLDLNEADVDGNTALHHAVINESAEMVRLLMESDPPPELKENKAGYTPLELGNITRELAEKLIPYASEDQKKSALDKACKALPDHPEKVTLLLELGVKAKRKKSKFYLSANEKEFNGLLDQYEEKRLSSLIGLIHHGAHIPKETVDPELLLTAAGHVLVIGRDGFKQNKDASIKYVEFFLDLPKDGQLTDPRVRLLCHLLYLVCEELYVPVTWASKVKKPSGRLEDLSRVDEVLGKFHAKFATSDTPNTIWSWAINIIRSRAIPPIQAEEIFEPFRRCAMFFKDASKPTPKAFNDFLQPFIFFIQYRIDNAPGHNCTAYPQSQGVDALWSDIMCRREDTAERIRGAKKAVQFAENMGITGEKCDLEVGSYFSIDECNLAKSSSIAVRESVRRAFKALEWVNDFLRFCTFFGEYRSINSGYNSADAPFHELVTQNEYAHDLNLECSKSTIADLLIRVRTRVAQINAIEKTDRKSLEKALLKPNKELHEAFQKLNESSMPARPTRSGSYKKHNLDVILREISTLRIPKLNNHNVPSHDDVIPDLVDIGYEAWRKEIDLIVDLNERTMKACLLVNKAVTLLGIVAEDEAKFLLALKETQKNRTELVSKITACNQAIEVLCAGLPKGVVFSDAILEEHNKMKIKFSAPRKFTLFSKNKTLDEICYEEQHCFAFSLEVMKRHVDSLDYYMGSLNEERERIRSELQDKEKQHDEKEGELLRKAEGLSALKVTLKQQVSELRENVDKFNATISLAEDLSASSELIDAYDHLRKRINTFGLFAFKKSQPNELVSLSFSIGHCEKEYKEIAQLAEVQQAVTGLSALLEQETTVHEKTIAASNLALKREALNDAVTALNQYKVELHARIKVCESVENTSFLPKIDKIAKAIPAVDSLDLPDEPSCDAYQEKVKTALARLNSIALEVKLVESTEAQKLQAQETARKLEAEKAEKAASAAAEAATAKLAAEQAAKQAAALVDREQAVEPVVDQMNQTLSTLTDLIGIDGESDQWDANEILPLIVQVKKTLKCGPSPHTQRITCPTVFFADATCVEVAIGQKEALDSLLKKAEERSDDLKQKTVEKFHVCDRAAKQLKAGLGRLTNFPLIEKLGNEKYFSIKEHIVKFMMQGGIKWEGGKKPKSLKHRCNEIAFLQGLADETNEAISLLQDKIKRQKSDIKKARTGVEENMKQVADDLQPYALDSDFTLYYQEAHQLKVDQSTTVSLSSDQDAALSFWTKCQQKSATLLSSVTECVQENEAVKAAAEIKAAEAGRVATENKQRVDQCKQDIEGLQTECEDFYKRIEAVSAEKATTYQARYDQCCDASNDHDLNALQSRKDKLCVLKKVLGVAEGEVSKKLRVMQKGVADIRGSIEEAICTLGQKPKEHRRYMSLHDQAVTQTIQWLNNHLIELGKCLGDINDEVKAKNEKDTAAKERAVHDLNEKIGELNTAVTKINDRLMKSTTGAQLDIDMVSGYTALRKSLDPEKKGFLGSFFSAQSKDTPRKLLVIKVSAAVDQMQLDKDYEVSGTVSAFIDTLVRKTKEVEAHQHACDIQAVQEDIHARSDVLKAEYAAIHRKIAHVDRLLQEASSSEGSLADRKELLVRVKDGVHIVKIKGLKGKMKKIYKGLEDDDRTEAEQATIEVLKKRAESIQSFTSASPENVKYCEELYADFEKLSTQFVDNSKIKVQIKECRKEIKSLVKAIPNKGKAVEKKAGIKIDLEKFKQEFKTCSVEQDFSDLEEKYSALLQRVKAPSPSLQELSEAALPDAAGTGYVAGTHSPERFFAVVGTNSSDPVPRALNDLRDDVRAYYRQARSPEDICCVQNIVETINAIRGKYSPDRMNAEIKGLFEPYINAQEAVVRIGPMLESVAGGESISPGLRAHLATVLKEYDACIYRKVCGR